MARYLALQAFKSWSHDETFKDDVEIERHLVAAEQAIDNALLRRIELAGEVASPRMYAPRHAHQSVLAIDDAAEIVSVTESGAPLALGVDVIAEPLNGISASGDPRPSHSLVRSTGYWSCAGRLPTVTVVARWGWPAIPAEIVTAGYIEAADRLRNREVRHGLVDVTDAGGVGARVNRTVAAMIRDYAHPIRSVAIA